MSVGRECFRTQPAHLVLHSGLSGAGLADGQRGRQSFGDDFIGPHISKLSAAMLALATTNTVLSANLFSGRSVCEDPPQSLSETLDTDYIYHKDLSQLLRRINTVTGSRLASTNQNRQPKFATQTSQRGVMNERALCRVIHHLRCPFASRNVTGTVK
ncbi:unnamed protein product [Leuciscus chuanchicus]